MATVENKYPRLDIDKMLDKLKEYNQRPKDYILWYNPSDFTKEFMKQFESEVDIEDSYLVPRGQCILMKKEDILKIKEPSIYDYFNDMTSDDDIKDLM